MEGNTGFPRRLDQAEYFEEHVGLIYVVLVLDCPEETAVQYSDCCNVRRGDDGRHRDNPKADCHIPNDNSGSGG